MAGLEDRRGKRLANQIPRTPEEALRIENARLERENYLLKMELDQQKVAAYQEEIKDIPLEKIAYVDESGVDTYLYREYGYALRGQQVLGQVRGRKY